MINVKETRYDKFRSLDNNAANDQSFGAKWITDLEVSHGVTEKLRVAAGAYNIFDVYPEDRKRVVWGKMVSVRVDLGGRRISNTKQNRQSIGNCRYDRKNKK